VAPYPSIAIKEAGPSLKSGLEEVVAY